MPEQRTPVRRLRTAVFGDGPTDLELAAIDEGREFFGAGAHIAIRPGWCASPAHLFPGGRISEKRYGAEIIIDQFDDLP